MNNLTLRQLRYFEALARHGHFGRAADACAISQPALSVQIKDLEESLGTPLFERGPRQVTLTAFGKDCALRVREILQGVDELGEMARAAQKGLMGRLRIGVIPTIAPYLLPGLIGRLSQQFPNLELDVRETVTPKLLEMLGDGQLDTAIVALPVLEPAFEERPLFDESLMLVRPQSQQAHPVPTAAQLGEMRLLMLEEGHCFRDQALSFCNLQGVRRSGLEGSSLSTLVQMVGAGIGVTLIPEMAAAVETRSAPVCVNRFAAPEPTRTVGMIWRKSNPLAGQLHEIAQVVQDVACGLPKADQA
ncbi:MAG: LysR substrate-binding domain-containing protein [Yoonia sp.]|uniref:LysR substrate-binding domain-containing protein n=1 Tax=Yoonia sp. TaxID=2212373 RepID=UPI003EF3A823